MKALNHSQILSKYFIFLGYFTGLLLVTILLAVFYHKACESYLIETERMAHEIDIQNNDANSLSLKIDSLNLLLKLLNTDQVQNEIALERSIIKLKVSTLKKFSEIDFEGDDKYKLYKGIIFNVETALENKRNFTQAKSDEEFNRKKLLECIEANKKVRKDYEN